MAKKYYKEVTMEDLRRGLKRRKKQLRPGDFGPDGALNLDPIDDDVLVKRLDRADGGPVTWEHYHKEAM